MILGAKGGSFRSKKMETIVYKSNANILDLLIRSILIIINNNIGR